MAARPWSHREEWKETVSTRYVAVGTAVETYVVGEKYHLKYRWLYCGHDMATAREIVQWARSRGIEVKCFGDDDAMRPIEID